MIRSLSYRHQTWQVFSDFLEMSAISISNSVDWNHKDEREKIYLETVKRYSKDELSLFPQMFACLVGLLESAASKSGPTDVLGDLFHELELHNRYKGQFFTPSPICDFMGEISITDNDEVIAKNGYITMCEPCAGSGAMIFGFAKAMKNNKYNYQTQMVVTAIDVDIKCVHMTYLQLSLYGIPAVVIHGNFLTEQEWSRWYTPNYLMNGWIWRESCGMTTRRSVEDEMIKCALEPMYAAIRKAEMLIAECSLAADTEPQPPNSFYFDFSKERLPVVEKNREKKREVTIEREPVNQISLF